ncbi:MAG: ARMT1-like domain-containing protein [Candidatus Margulisiibacteriota bacterium]|nr:ARMT1-like domain-containing protein [Candidatus Margulisiibacteriota bacterium]
MKTYLDCIPCFFRQALDAARMAGADETVQKKVLDELARLVPGLALEASPPEIGREIYALVAKISGEKDPFLKVKKKSNELALGFYPKLKKRVKGSSDPLLTAVELAIAGNIIDYGVKNSLDIEKETAKIFSEDEEIEKAESKSVFDYLSFGKAAKSNPSILYLADNAGEVVFDRVLIEELFRMGKKITYVVKESPVINDALREDAVGCGIDKVATIISSGSDAPGTVLKYCSPEFIQIFNQAKMIISKGQGNFEALSEEKNPIFFLFRAKCPVVARDIGGRLGDVILKCNLGGKRKKRK